MIFSGFKIGIFIVSMSYDKFAAFVTQISSDYTVYFAGASTIFLFEWGKKYEIFMPYMIAF